MDVKMLVIACNAMTAAAYEAARERYDLPVIGVIQPAVRSAVRATHNRRIGVLGTPVTIGSGEYQRALSVMGSDVEIYCQRCPAFVDRVEAGEHLGFLPGDLEAKINPYLRPLLDALHDLMDYDQIRRYMGNDLIEIAPLAYMRGRTLNDAVIILDEGQNATVSQMKMFLTRMGENARIVVTGDVTQVDLPAETVSGLADAVERLRDVPGVGTVILDRSDIVRHPLVQAIVNAYEANPDPLPSRPNTDQAEEAGATASG